MTVAGVDRVAIRVSPHTIRLRILKGRVREHPVVVVCCFIPHDTIEDTERTTPSPTPKSKTQFHPTRSD